MQIIRRKLKIRHGNRAHRIQHASVMLKSLVPHFYPKMHLDDYWRRYFRNPSRLAWRLFLCKVSTLVRALSAMTSLPVRRCEPAGPVTWSAARSVTSYPVYSRAGLTSTPSGRWTQTAADWSTPRARGTRASCTHGASLTPSRQRSDRVERSFNKFWRPIYKISYDSS